MGVGMDIKLKNPIPASLLRIETLGFPFDPDSIHKVLKVVWPEILKMNKTFGGVRSLKIMRKEIVLEVDRNEGSPAYAADDLYKAVSEALAKAYRKTKRRD